VSTYLEKVTAFVTRRGARGVELLLFQHPHAGVQFPAGTVNPGEPPEQAVLRETAEETGLTAVRVVAAIGWRDELPPGATHVLLEQVGVCVHPQPDSRRWGILNRGIALRLLRHIPGWAQVTYEETDRYTDPTYITFQVTGWVEEASLAPSARRHFFHLEAEGAADKLPAVRTDHHTFQPFWAPLADLPEIIAPQHAWLDYVMEELGYSFG